VITFVSMACVAVSVSGFVAAMLRARVVERRLHGQSHPLHELRGALSALGLGLLLVERSVPPFARNGGGEGNDFIDALRGQLDRAQSAAQEVDALRIGVEGVDPGERKRLELAEVVPARVRMWAQLAPAYGASIRIDWRAGSAPVLGDRERLTRAIDNLICNALEHGGGRVSIEGERLSGRVRVTVRDQGPGIGAEIADRSDAHWSSPRGHGLAIAREAILDHDGTLVARGGLLGGQLIVHLPLADRLKPMNGYLEGETRCGPGSDRRVHPGADARRRRIRAA
jgi:signal transduction histidine kinase